jgi:hypothetical protein
MLWRQRTQECILSMSRNLKLLSQRGDSISSMHFRHFDSAWKHSNIVVMYYLLIAHSWRGKYEGTMIIAIGIDANRQLVLLAFAIVEKENSGSWDWFLHLVQREVVGPWCEICVISDRHAGILNVVRELIPNNSCVHHRWCTWHLAQNLIKHDGIKENFKLFEEVCRQTDEKNFKKKLKGLERRTNKKGKKKF